MAPDPAFGQVGDWLPACAAADAPASLASAADPRGGSSRPGSSPIGSATTAIRTACSPATTSPCCMARGTPTGATGCRCMRRPPICLRIDLGRFNPDLAGYAIWGRVADGAFVPYYTRAEIDDGALAGRNLELVWVDDPIAGVLPADPGLGPGPAGRRLGGPGRLRGAERPALPGDRPRSDRDRGAQPRSGLAADDPGLAQRPSRRRRDPHGAQPLLHLLSGASRAHGRRRAARQRGRAAHGRALAGGRSPLPAARRAGLAGRQRAPAGRSRGARRRSGG